MELIAIFSTWIFSTLGCYVPAVRVRALQWSHSRKSEWLESALLSGDSFYTKRTNVICHLLQLKPVNMASQQQQWHLCRAKCHGNWKRFSEPLNRIVELNRGVTVLCLHFMLCVSVCVRAHAPHHLFNSWLCALKMRRKLINGMLANSFDEEKLGTGATFFSVGLLPCSAIIPFMWCSLILPVSVVSLDGFFFAFRCIAKMILHANWGKRRGKQQPKTKLFLYVIVNLLRFQRKWEAGILIVMDNGICDCFFARLTLSPIDKCIFCVHWSHTMQAYIRVVCVFVFFFDLLSVI